MTRRSDIEEYGIEVPGGTVFVRKWTPGTPSSDTPLVLLHDSLGSVDLWREFPKALAEGLSRPVIAYDRLGFGRSDPRIQLPGFGFIEEEATLYFPALKKGLSLGSYVLFGHSVGGGMALNIAARDPDCMAVITESCQALVEDLTIAGIRDAQRQFEQPGQMERLKKWHGSKAAWVLRAWTEIWLSPEFSNWSLGDCIGKVVCPLLAIHGERDEFGSLAAPEYVASRSGGFSEMFILPGCGHVPHAEQPAQVIDAVKAFLRGQLPSSVT